MKAHYLSEGGKTHLMPHMPDFRPHAAFYLLQITLIHDGHREIYKAAQGGGRDLPG